MMFSLTRDKKQATIGEKGFTIIELMIATLVFSFILVIITTGVISFTNRYYKSVNSSATQGTVRSVMDTVSQSIQFSGAPITPTSSSTNYFCAGGYSFTYDQGALYTGGSGGIYMAPMSSSCSATTTGGKQLLSKNQRVTKLVVETAGPNLYKVSIGISLGDNELLCSTNASVTAGNCNGSGTVSDANIKSFPDDLSCYGGAGSPYCAVSSLVTVVEKRIGT